MNVFQNSTSCAIQVAGTAPNTLNAQGNYWGRDGDPGSATAPVLNCEQVDGPVDFSNIITSDHSQRYMHWTPNCFVCANGALANIFKGMELVNSITY